MAVLIEADRAELAAEIMRALSMVREPIACLKTEIRAAVDAADTWANSNAAEYNTALPAAFRNAASADQKSRLLELVIIKRRARGS